jgi:hypothetical protein
MSKKRILVSGDWQQYLYRFRNHLTHDVSFNFDLMLEEKDGKLSVVELKITGYPLSISCLGGF